MKRLNVHHLLAPVGLACLCAGGAAYGAQAPFHIGFCVDSVSQGEGDQRAAELVQKKYGNVTNGGMVRIVIIPDDFMSQQETYISNLVSLAEDPLMKVIVTCQMVPGTAEAYKRIRAKRPDILLMGALPAEDPLVIGKAADVILDIDFISRGYTIPWVAKQLGAKTFVHVSFPRHMSYETLGRRRAVMEQACKDLDLKWVFQTAPDPTSDVGVPGAQQFLLEKMPMWIHEYSHGGKERVAFFGTNDAQAEPMIKCVAASSSGVYVEPGTASPILGFPGALGLDLSAERGNWPAIMKKIEQAVLARNASGRIGTWSYGSSYIFTQGLGEFGKRVQEGKAKVNNPKDIIKALQDCSPGAKWNVSGYSDMSTGSRIKSYWLALMDTYIFGKGYMGTTALKVPEKYYHIAK